MYKKIIWPLLVVSALALTILFLSGFVVSLVISQNDGEGPAEEVTENSETIPDETVPPQEASDLLILGDSIGYGVGDEEDLGIGERYLALVSEEDDDETGIANISVPGYDSSQLVDQIESGEHTSSISTAQLIILSIGGNDLNRLMFEDSANLPLLFDDTLNTYTANLEFIIAEIRAINPDAQIALIGLYNPYSDEDPALSRFLLEWNYETRLIADSDAGFAYIPTYELFEYHLDLYLSVDQFHPNAAGYQAIAETLYRILN